MSKSQHPRGVSIVIVMILTGIMLAFSVGASLLMTSSSRQIARIVAASDAYYAAEGALEKGLLKMSEFGVGFDGQNYPVELTKIATDGKENFGLKQIEIQKCEAKFGQNSDKCNFDNSEEIPEAKWNLIGFAPEDENHQIELTPNSQGIDGEADGDFYYSIPIAGTGTAGGQWCDQSKTVPLATGTAADETGMHKFVADYESWVDEIFAKYDGDEQPASGGADGSGAGGNGAAGAANIPSIDPNEMPAADHPCHWNRLYPSSIGGGGEKPGVVTVPLFIQYEDLSGTVPFTVIKNPSSTFRINGITGALSDPDPYGDIALEGGIDGGLRFGLNDTDANPDQIIVRFRTPCMPLKVGPEKFVERTVCTPDERYELDTGITGDGDNVLVAWQIEELETNPCGKLGLSSECTNNEAGIYKIKHGVGPIETGNKDNTAQLNNPLAGSKNSTEIRENFLNQLRGNGSYMIINNETGIVTNYVDKVQDEYDLGNVNRPLSEYLKNFSLEEFAVFGKVNDWDQWKLFKPVLRMTSINTLKADHNIQGLSTNIPYLEYQVLSSVNFQPFSDAHQTVVAEAWARGIKQSIEVKVPQESSVLQYVIQQ